MALDRSAVIDKVQKLADAPSVYEGLKAKAEVFLEAVDTPQEKSAFRTLIDEIKSDVLTIDQLISFTESANGVALFGAQRAGEYHAAAKQAKEQGEDTCICPACQAGKEILANQAAIVS